MSNAISAGIIGSCARALAGPVVRWVNSCPEERQRIYFANHTSHLDFVVLWSALPPSLRIQTRPVAAKDYWSSGLKKRFAVNAFHALLVERKGSKSSHEECCCSAERTLQLLFAALDKGDSLIIFPEGTRGDGETIGPFKSGIYHLWARQPDIQFVPVHLSNLNRILPKGEFLPVPVISRVSFGPPLQLNQDETRESFLEKAHAAVCALKEV